MFGSSCRTSKAQRRVIFYTSRTSNERILSDENIILSKKELDNLDKKLEKEKNFLTKYNELKSRKINVTDTVLNKTENFNSLIKACDYIKSIEGKADRVTIRKYINTSKLYQKR